MIKATQATKNRLKKLDTELSKILLERIEIAENIEGCIADGLTLTHDDYNKGYYTNDCLYIKAAEWEKKYFRGFYTRHENLIACTLTLGNNEVTIPDINKMVKAMITDLETA